MIVIVTNRSGVAVQRQFDTAADAIDAVAKYAADNGGAVEEQVDALRQLLGTRMVALVGSVVPSPAAGLHMVQWQPELEEWR